MTGVQTLLAGSAFTIQVVVQEDVSPVVTFLREELEQSERMKIGFLLGQIAEHGLPHNEEKFRNEGNGIYAIKAQVVRLYGFFDGQRKMTLTHGFKKHARGGKNAQARQRERAEHLRSLLLAERAREGRGR